MNDKSKEALTNLKPNMELLEERAVINKEKVTAAQVQISKVVKTRTVNIPVILEEEVLVIETNQPENTFCQPSLGDNEYIKVNEERRDVSSTRIIINGQQVCLHDLPHEITLSKQVASVEKQTYAVEEVIIDTTKKSTKDHIEVDLRHEELTIDKKNISD